MYNIPNGEWPNEKEHLLMLLERSERKFKTLAFVFLVTLIIALGGIIIFTATSKERFNHKSSNWHIRQNIELNRQLQSCRAHKPCHYKGSYKKQSKKSTFNSLRYKYDADEY